MLVKVESVCSADIRFEKIKMIKTVEIILFFIIVSIMNSFNI